MRPLAASSFRKSLPKSHFSGDEVLIAMKAWCDGSGNRGSSDFLVLGGVVAEDSLWAQVDDKWKEIRLSRTPSAPYLHMKELRAKSGAFSHKLGWNDKGREAYLRDCLMYAQTLDKERFRTFCCTVDMRHYRSLERRGALLPSPIAICNHFVPYKIFRWHLDSINVCKSPELFYYFDQNEPFIKPFKNLVAGNQTLFQPNIPSNPWDLIVDTLPVDMRKYPGVQLADLIAWAQFRKLTKDAKEPYANLHIFTEGVLPFFRKDIDVTHLDLIAMTNRFDEEMVTDYFNPKI